MSKNDNIVSFPSAVRDVQSGRRLIPERITEARTAHGWTQTELAAAIGAKRQSISYYEKGDRTPDPLVLKKISEVLEQPVSYFISDAAPNFGPRTINFFRKQGPNTLKRNAAHNQYAEWFSQAAFAFDEYVNFPTVDLPSFEPEESYDGRYTVKEIEKFAEQTREAFGLGYGPISNTLRLAEKKGVIVSRLFTGDDKVEAFSFWSGDRPFIFLASQKKSAVRARYDLCHELAHLVLHRWVSSEDMQDKYTLKEIEKEADLFAGAFLLPRKSFTNEVYTPKLTAFIDLKRRWKVSIQAMIYRCKTLGIFDEDQTVNLYKQISYKKWRTCEPLDESSEIPFEEPLLMRRVAELVLQSGSLSREEITSRLTFSPRITEALIGLEPMSLSVNDDSEYDLDLK